jgi:hypothetical protein
MAKSWRVAKGLLKLREQINAQYPGRRKDSDGTIGNTEHSSRESDHNPDGNGVVHALDTTHDPAHGFDSYAFSDMLIRARDSRIKYVISNRRIASGAAGPSPWVWRKYTGKNPHDHHNHVSIRYDARYADDETPWALDGAPTKDSPSTAHVAENYTPPPRTLKQGTSGMDVRTLQQLLHTSGVTVDGKFGKATLSAVIDFQKRAKLHADGIVGPQTWTALRAAV